MFKLIMLVPASKLGISSVIYFSETLKGVSLDQTTSIGIRASSARRWLVREPGKIMIEVCKSIDNLTIMRRRNPCTNLDEFRHPYWH
jgi:hypothetical protein